MEDVKDIFGELHYEIIRKIAEGGMGVVYEARQLSVGNFQKIVAIKVIKEEFSIIDEFRNNFIGEAKLVSDLIHSGIVQMYNLGFHEGMYYMVMEYVNGITLEDFIMKHEETNQHIPVDLAVFITSRVVRALSYAHNRRSQKGQLLGIVHRDVNPKNIMIAQEGDVKLTDFGIAKAFESNHTGDLQDLMYNKEGDSIAGKDEYLSPEQARCEVTDARSDLFACGIVMSEALLGYNLFLDEDGVPEKTINNVIEMPLPDFPKLRSDLDESICKILSSAMDRNINTRYQSASKMLKYLEYYIYGSGYGPTNEKLNVYVKDLMGENGETAAQRWTEGGTPGL